MPPGAPGTAPVGLGSRNEPLARLQRGCVGVLGLGGWGGQCCWAPAPGRRQRDPPAAPLCRGTPEISRSPAINTADEGRGGWHEPRRTAAEAQDGARPGLQAGAHGAPHAR